MRGYDPSMVEPGRLAPVRAHPTLRLPAVTAPALLVGRSRRCDVVLDDPTVSGAHAALMLYAGRCYLTDRGSTNGTFVNGRRVWGTVTVEPGDRVRFGLTSLRLAPPG
jgi:pSer/pThr/pTyr-binding forkhead associated (FHA) protein